MLHYSPIISAPLEFRGSNNFPTTYAFIKYNSLDKQVFPKRGVKIDAEAGWVLKQNENITVLQDGDVLPREAYPIGTNPYSRIVLNVESYHRITGRTTAMTMLQSGINMNYTNNIMNEFSIGGLIPLYNNQVLFAGLPEATTYAPTVAAFMGGIRYEFLASTYVTGKANVLFTNFMNKSIFFDNASFLSGYSLTFGYNFALGPLEISAMYADQSKKLRTYVSFGIPF